MFTQWIISPFDLQLLTNFDFDLYIESWQKI